MPHAIRVLQGKCLRGKSAHRPSHYPHALETECLDDKRGVVGKRDNVEWLPVIRGAADPVIVEQEQLVVRRESVDER
jgi:hypothetical protein